MGQREKQTPKEDTHFLQALWSYGRAAAFPVITDWYKLRWNPKAQYLHVHKIWVRADSTERYYTDCGWWELPDAYETELQVTQRKKKARNFSITGLLCRKQGKVKEGCLFISKMQNLSLPCMWILTDLKLQHWCDKLILLHLFWYNYLYSTWNSSTLLH